MKPRLAYAASAVAALMLALTSSRAHAFSQPSYYPRAAALGGGGGRWFTGTAADGYACTVCHSGSQSWPLHVAGLPSAGYVPGARYKVRLQWPEFSARAAQIQGSPSAAHGTATPTVASAAQMPGAEHAGPDMSVLAELSTHAGLGAGQLEMNYENIDAPEREDEWCNHLPGVPASQLFDTAATPLDQPVLQCTASRPGQRCILAVQVCGARTLSFTWTAPQQDVGPIWFNAGMVATEHLSADSNFDDVTLVALPIYPAASASQTYTESLDHGCSAVSTRGRSHPWLASMLLAGLTLYAARRRRLIGR